MNDLFANKIPPTKADRLKIFQIEHYTSSHINLERTFQMLIIAPSLNNIIQVNYSFINS